MALGGATVTITGGTGSFGSTMTRYLLTQDVSQINILSRDETKQDELRRQLGDERVKFYLGDVRDAQSLVAPMKDADYVFHAAALKQVPSCEFFPQQAVLTNVVGSHNVITAAAAARARSLVCLSTDKAVYPINAMGMSKALMEKTVQAFARNNPDSQTTVSITRYGNVMYSRGSVIPMFMEQLRTHHPLTITDPSMTRFLMSLADSVELVLHAFEHALPGDLFVRKAPACRLDTLARAVASMVGVEDPELRVLGIRHGEKLHESLLGEEDMIRASDEGDYFRVPLDARSLQYNLYFDEGEKKSLWSRGFDSANAERLDVRRTKNVLARLPEFQQFLERAS